ncbi:hypothetical protein [Clostridium sp. C105KSO13]|nr:hypothetical protein [Clostridium sp. C105KSO13]
MLIAYEVLDREQFVNQIEKCDANVHESIEWMNQLIFGDKDQLLELR